VAGCCSSESSLRLQVVQPALATRVSIRFKLVKFALVDQHLKPRLRVVLAKSHLHLAACGQLDATAIVQGDAVAIGPKIAGAKQVKITSLPAANGITQTAASADQQQ
jgi:hypothetical protein